MSSRHDSVFNTKVSAAILESQFIVSDVIILRVRNIKSVFMSSVLASGIVGKPLLPPS